jgi:hypothetical protein
MASRRSSSLTLEASSSEAIGSPAAYSAAGGLPARSIGARRWAPEAAMARVAVGRTLQRLQADVVGVGEGGLLAADGAHADALLDVEAARLDDAFFQAPGLGTRVLEIQVGVIDVVPEQLAEDALELVRRQSVRAQQGLLGDLEMGESGW